jgi:HEAT repeat protein
MSILDKLASSLNRRDEVPNQELAAQIVAAKDAKAIRELVDNLANKSKGIRHDCIKTLYEIGELNPSLIAPHVDEFIKLLESKDNRLQWGAMSALNRIAAQKHKELFNALPLLAAAVERGSVITRDNYVGILAMLMSKGYADNVFHLMHEQLLTSLVNQLPMYAEMAAPAVPEQHKAAFIDTLTDRLKDIEQESKRKRIEKVLKKARGK